MVARAGLAGAEARRRRGRAKQKARLRVIEPEVDERDEFVESVRRDLDALPTIEEHEPATSGSIERDRAAASGRPAGDRCAASVDPRSAHLSAR